MEMLWSGAGCADNPAFEFVKHSDNGVPLYRKVASGEVKLEQDGATFIIKRAAAQEENMSSLTETLVKALKANPADSEKDASRKALIQKQLATGVLKAEAFAAELIIEAKAREIVKSGQGLSYEQAYVKVLETDADLVAALYS